MDIKVYVLIIVHQTTVHICYEKIANVRKSLVALIAVHWTCFPFSDVQLELIRRPCMFSLKR